MLQKESTYTPQRTSHAFTNVIEKFGDENAASKAKIEFYEEKITVEKV